MAAAATAVAPGLGGGARRTWGAGVSAEVLARRRRARSGDASARPAIVIAEEDVPFEEALSRNPYTVRSWVRYLEHKAGATHAERFVLFERAVALLPGSYKLWNKYLRERVACLHDKPLSHPWYAATNAAFERALVNLYKMPKMWEAYATFLSAQCYVTQTRRVLDRALQSLPVTQHERIWKVYLDFVVAKHVPPETAVRVYRRYLKTHAEKTEDYVAYLQENEYWGEVATQLAWILNQPQWDSESGRTPHETWLELCDILSRHPDEIPAELAVEPIIRTGISRFEDKVGRLWCALADYFIRRGAFGKARDIYEEGLATVSTVRDFSQVFDAYAQFEESMLNHAMREEAAASDSTGDSNPEFDFSDVDLELRFARFEWLSERQPLLINAVLLRQNPNNVPEWLKRGELYAKRNDDAMVIKTYTEGLQAVDAVEAVGRVYRLWIAFAQFYESKLDIEGATLVYEKAVVAKYKAVDGLCNVWCHYAEMMLRQKRYAEAHRILRRATTVTVPNPSKVDFYDDSKTVQDRLFKATRLWAFYADMEEMLGTLESTRAVYNRMLELRVATPQIVINYAALLAEHNYFEDSFNAFERGISQFPYPHVYPIWRVYLTKFVERYKGTKLERARDLFEEALGGADKDAAKNLFLMYARLEEEHGLAKRAMAIYLRATEVVKPEDRLEVYRLYLSRTAEFFGITHTRPVFERALEALDPLGARKMCLEFAEVERTLGEIDRAREIFRYGSQFCNPLADSDYWAIWMTFEKRHGNEDTFREMLRLKRSVQARFNTLGTFVDAPNPGGEDGGTGVGSKRKLDAMQDLEVSSGVPQAPDAHIGFVKATDTGLKIGKKDGAAAGGERTGANTEEIVLDDSDDDDDDAADAGPAAVEAQPVPKAVFGGLDDIVEKQNQAA